MNQQPVPYTTYIYLTQVELPGYPEKYSLHVMLWMPKNYKLVGVDNEQPQISPPPPTDTYYYRLILEDENPDSEDDISTCLPIPCSFQNIDRQSDKDVLLVHYVISNETQSKIRKKPKSKVAYIHADKGGANPNPIPPDVHVAEM
jgi:hypothetical protein